MNFQKHYLSIIILSFILFLGCSNDDSVDKVAPPTEEIELSKATFTIEELLSTFPDTKITGDSVALELSIIGNDISGNIINTLYLKDESGAIALEISGENLYDTFPVGQVIILNCKGMTLNTEDKTLVKETALNFSNFRESINITTENEDIRNIFILYRDISDDLLNQLVEIRGFQFDEIAVGKPMQSGTSGFVELRDNKDSVLLIQIRNQADFANMNVPEGSGPIVGILEKDQDSYYIIPRSFNDMGFSFTRNAPFEKRTFEFGGNNLPYQIMFPFNYNETNSYPLVVFLHGAGERGTNNTSQMAFGPETFGSYSARQNYPSIVIFPQCPSDVMWSRRNKYTDTTGELIFEFPVEPDPNYAMEMVIELVNEMIVKEAVDSDRIYISGLSMGGIGAFEFAYYAPTTPAAVASIAGGHDSTLLNNYGSTIAFSLYHGSNDGVVPPRYSREMFEKMQELGYNSQYFEAAGRGHEWSYVLEDPSYIEWLFNQSK